jgi:subtilisin-like proprotein convertase family protein
LVPGATGAEFFVPAASPVDEGEYVLRVSNAAGVAASGPAKVSVHPEPPGFAPLAVGESAMPLTVSQFTTNRSPVRLTVPFAATRIAVTMRLLHKDTNDLSAALIAPGGQRAQLFKTPNPSGRDFDHTVFDDTSTLHLVDSLPPYRGTYQSGNTLNALRAFAVSGDWFLEIENGGGQNATLESWELIVEGAVAPVTWESWRNSTLAGQIHSAPDEDADGDGVSNAQEWLFGPPSGFDDVSTGITGLILAEDGSCQFRWQGWQSVSYQLEWSLDLLHWQAAVEDIDYTTLWTSRTEPARTEQAVRLTIPGAVPAFWRLRGR